MIEEKNKKPFCFQIFILCSLLIFFPVCIYSESNEFDFGKFSFALSPKIFKDGSITDMYLGYAYTDKMDFTLRLRYSAISKNEKLEGVKDSLNAVNESIFDIFLLPAQYNIIKKPTYRFWLAGGLYYQFDKLNEKGFFNMPKLENMIPPKERVNSYTNDLSMHILGPLADFGYKYNSRLFNMTFSGGIVPVFFLYSSQNMSMVPLLDPQTADYSQNTFGSPFFYLSLDSVILKYFNVLLLYDFAKLSYKAIDFDSNQNWITPERDFITQSFKIEVSALLPLNDSFQFQIGYGYILDLVNADSDANIAGNRQYIILTAKKIGN
jgi:hypothetical protein